jgi:hypothetical protein
VGGRPRILMKLPFGTASGGPTRMAKGACVAGSAGTVAVTAIVGRDVCANAAPAINIEIDRAARSMRAATGAPGFPGLCPLAPRAGLSAPITICPLPPHSIMSPRAWCLSWTMRLSLALRLRPLHELLEQALLSSGIVGRSLGGLGAHDAGIDGNAGGR